MSNSRVRLLALIGPLAGERHVRQSAGFPIDPSQMLPVADVVLLVSDDDGPGAMLFRYTAHGDFGGDTWHDSTSDAWEQATDEYGDALGPWLEVPDEIRDPHEYAIRFALEQLNDRGKW